MDRYTAIYLITLFFLLLVVAKMVGVFHEKRRTSFKALLLSFLSIYFMFCFLHLYVITHLSSDWLATDILAFFVGSFVISLHYESTIGRRLASTLFIGVIMIFSMLPIGVVIEFVFPNILLNGVERVAMTNIAVIPIAYLVAALMSRFKNIKKKVMFPRIALIAPLSAAVIFIIFLGTGIMYTFGIDITEEVGIVLLLVLIVWLIFSNFFMFNILSAKYEEKLKSEQQAQEKEYYFAQCQLMQESAEQIRAVRHDIKLHLATLKGFTINGDLEDIKGYLDSLVADIEKSEIYSNTGNIAFDSIINYKLQNAKSDNIKLDLNVAVPPELNVEVVDIVTIIGNLLDNALEAVAKVNEKIIKIDIKFNKGGLFAKIENSFNGEVQYDEGMAESSIVSLKGSNEHGYGLKNIKQSVEKYNGHMKISHKDNIFSTGIFLYVSD